MNLAQQLDAKHRNSKEYNVTRGIMPACGVLLWMYFFAGPDRYDYYVELIFTLINCPLVLSNATKDGNSPNCYLVELEM